MNLIRQAKPAPDSHSLTAVSSALACLASDTICRYYLVPFLANFWRLLDIHIKVTNRTSSNVRGFWTTVRSIYSDELSKLRAQWNAEYPCCADSTIYSSPMRPIFIVGDHPVTLHEL